MSRLKMKSGTTLIKIGDALLNLSDANIEASGTYSQSDIPQLKKEFRDLFEPEDPQTQEVYLDGIDSWTFGTSKGSVLRFHFDETIADDNIHVVNVVVPDLSGKKLQQRVIDKADDKGLPGDPKAFDLDDFAAEALGMVTILSCGG